jgi:hypothetical protein
MYHMKKILLLLIFLLVIPFSVHAQQSAYGNVSGNYIVPAGSDTAIINTNIPITLEDSAYPLDIFYFFAIIGVIGIFGGIWFSSRPDQIPCNAIIACGILACGAFYIASVMAPLVAVQQFSTDITNVQPATIYLTETNIYVFSPWVSWAMDGGAIAGFIVALLGTLSYLGWFSRKGLKDAWNGKYLETEDGSGTPQPGKYE